MMITLLCLGILITAGCVDQGEPQPVETATEESAGYPVEGSGYPGPENAPGLPPYPIESMEEEVFQANLTPIAPPVETSADTGGFTILMNYMNSDLPVRGQLFFAAEMIPVQEIEDGYVPKLDSSVARSGSTDAQGRLNISLIPPGKYALALMTPQGAILVEDDATGDTIVFDVRADEVTDLGAASVRLNREALEP